MDWRVISKKDCKESNWMGGTVTELGIFPEESSYRSRDFLWRLCVETCTEEEASLSKLPEFDRVMTVLQGAPVLAHEDVRVTKLEPFQQDAFDGSYRTKVFGDMTSYSLIVRKGNQASLSVLDLTKENEPLVLGDMGAFPQGTQNFYCADGFATLSIDGKMQMLREGDQLVLNYMASERPALSVMGEGHLLRCEIFYRYEEGAFGATKIEAEPASFADFKDCIFIANTQYRFSRYTNKRLKKIWYDEALQEAIGRINRFYLADLLYFIGIFAVAAFGFERFHSYMWVVAFVAWTLFHLFVLSPLLYFLVVPKPVANHIKDIDKLTPYEEKVRAEQMGRNERTDRILSRYKFSGTAEYDEDGNRLDDLSKKKF